MTRIAKLFSVTLKLMKKKKGVAVIIAGVGSERVAWTYILPNVK